MHAVIDSVLRIKSIAIANRRTLQDAQWLARVTEHGPDITVMPYNIPVGTRTQKRSAGTLIRKRLLNDPDASVVQTRNVIQEIAENEQLLVASNYLSGSTRSMDAVSHLPRLPIEYRRAD